MKLIYIINARIPTQMGHGYQVTKMCESFANIRRYTQIDNNNADTRGNNGEFLYPEITYKIRGACFRVWKHFRGGFKEKVIERALLKEFIDQGLKVENQKQIPIFYESRKMGIYVPDMIVDDKVLIELKSKPFLTKEDERQFWLYLKGTDYKLGLLINFGKKLEIKRRVYDKARDVSFDNLRESAKPEGQHLRLSAPIIELWVPTRENPIKEDAFRYYGLKQNFTVKKIESFDFLKYAKHLGALSFYLQGWWFFTKLLFTKIDKNAIVYTRNPEISYIFKLRGFKVIYECHEWFGRGVWLNLLFLRGVDCIIITNSFIKKEFIDRGFDEKKFLVAPNGVDFDIFDLNITKEKAIEKLIADGEQFSSGRTVLPKIKEKKILLYTGSLKLKGEKKGVDEILEALKILNNSEIIFAAVGGNDKDIDYYKQIADKLGIGDSVCFFSRQSQENLALFQKAADILLMPFPKIAHYEYYMCPLKMLEYMASGRPIIASDLPSIREILDENNALICRPGDVKDLAKKIGLLLDSQSLGERLAQQAREDVEQYAWTKRAERILGFIGGLS